MSGNTPSESTPGASRFDSAVAKTIYAKKPGLVREGMVGDRPLTPLEGEFLDAMVAAGRAQRTVWAFQTAFAAVEREAGVLPERFTGDAWARVARSRTMSPWTTYTHLGKLRTFHVWMLEQHCMPKGLGKGVSEEPLPEIPATPALRPLPPEHITAFRAAIDDLEWRMFLDLIDATGIAPAQALQLDVDHLRGVWQPGRMPPEIWLCASDWVLPLADIIAYRRLPAVGIVAALREYRSALELGRTGPLFRGEDGIRRTRTWSRDRWESHRNAARCWGAELRQLRHTFVVEELDRGVHSSVLIRWLGLRDGGTGDASAIRAYAEAREAGEDEVGAR